jgi:hypothetical protein
LRDDALLVVTLIQDTYDVASAGTVDSWITALRDAKGGDDDAFALLVLTTDVDVGYQQLCWPNLNMIPRKTRFGCSPRASNMGSSARSARRATSPSSPRPWRRSSISARTLLRPAERRPYASRSASWVVDPDYGVRLAVRRP